MASEDEILRNDVMFSRSRDTGDINSDVMFSRAAGDVNQNVMFPLTGDLEQLAAEENIKSVHQVRLLAKINIE